MLDINGALKAIGYGLLVLFFAIGVVKVGYGLDLMLAIFQIIQGMVSTIITQSGLSGSSGITLPQEIIDKINNVGFWDSIPLWAGNHQQRRQKLPALLCRGVSGRSYHCAGLHYLLGYGNFSACGGSQRFSRYCRMELCGRAHL